ncbi:hypothetical protein R0381_003612 [Jeongeupia wiesaeckerbachi]|uniref:hypothetical protein n=1 Tax=Jeongeupia wiesaeckerbachi TaxID=3051218 RepID=UPI003D8050C5
MALITVVIEDTPSGGISVYSNFKPPLAHLPTPAQLLAMSILSRPDNEPKQSRPNHQGEIA